MVKHMPKNSIEHIQSWTTKHVFYLTFKHSASIEILISDQYDTPQFSKAKSLVQSLPALEACYYDTGILRLAVLISTLRGLNSTNCWAKSKFSCYQALIDRN